MPRRALVALCVRWHIILRGNKCTACFYDHSDDQDLAPGENVDS